MGERKVTVFLNTLNDKGDTYFNSKNIVKSLQALLSILIILTKHDFSFNKESKFSVTNGNLKSCLGEKKYIVVYFK